MLTIELSSSLSNESIRSFPSHLSYNGNRTALTLNEGQKNIRIEWLYIFIRWKITNICVKYEEKRIYIILSPLELPKLLLPRWVRKLGSSAINGTLNHNGVRTIVFTDSSAAWSRASDSPIQFPSCLSSSAQSIRFKSKDKPTGCDTFLIP